MRTIKQILMIMAVVFSTNALSSQDIIDLTLVLPKSYEGISSEQAVKLNNRIKQLVSRNNISSDFFGGSFIISPSFDVIDRVVAEGGMKSVIKTNVELTLEVYEKGSKTVFASVTKPISGAGYSNDESLNNAITAISSTDPVFKKFFTSVKDKISSYYAENCEKFIKKAQYLIDTKDYETALIVINSIPDGISCSDGAKKMGVLIAQIKEEVKLTPVMQDTLKTEKPVSIEMVIEKPVIEDKAPVVKEIKISNTLVLRYKNVEYYGNSMTLNFELINIGNNDEKVAFDKIFVYDSEGAKFFPDKMIGGNQEFGCYSWGLMNANVVAVAGVNTKMKLLFTTRIASIVLLDLEIDGVKYKMRDLIK